MSHQIDITENGTTTLATEGKYCDRNIDVNVNVASSGGTEIEDGLISGTLSGHYRNDRVTKVKEYGFYAQNSLTSIDLSNATNISSHAIESCQNLTTINLPNATFIWSNSFAFCSRLANVNVPRVEQVGTSAFQYCRALKTIDLQSANYIEDSAFHYCIVLKTIDLQSASYIGSSVFRYCYSLTTVVLRSPSVCRLSSNDAFADCPHFLGTVNATYNPEGLKDGYIYVPDDLVEQYKVATNWATYASQIKPISELEE